jgi:hypothetical protein
MARINRTDLYVYDGVVSDNDYIIGSDGDTVGAKTKSYKMKDVRDFLLAGLSPTVGGTMQYTEYTYNGILTSPAAVLNALNPVFVVLPYHIVVVSVNGDKYILKSQNVTVGVGQTPLSDSNFILLRGDVSLGDGLDILKGYNVATKKHEFYSLKSTSLNLSKETISSIETGNILVEMKTDINLNIGVGSENVYKGYNAVNSKHEFKGIKDSVSLDVSSDTTDVSIEIKENLISTATGSAKSVYGSFNNSTKKHSVKGISTNTLVLSESSGSIFIDLPEDASAKFFYVNENYPTTDGNGSEAKPYKYLKQAFDAFKGSGTILAPQYAGVGTIRLLSNINVNSLAVDATYGMTYVSINKLKLNGGGFTLTYKGVQDYFISTEYLVGLDSKTTNSKLDNQIQMTFEDVTIASEVTHKVVRHLNYTSPTTTGPQNTSGMSFTNCKIIDYAYLADSVSYGETSVSHFGILVKAQNSLPTTNYNVYLENINWNGEGAFTVNGLEIQGSSSTILYAKNTTLSITNFNIYFNPFYINYQTIAGSVYSTKNDLSFIKSENTGSVGNQYKSKNYIGIRDFKETSQDAISGGSKMGGCASFYWAVGAADIEIYTGRFLSEKVNNLTLTDISTNGVLFSDFNCDLLEIADATYGAFRYTGTVPVSRIFYNVTGSSIKNIKQNASLQYVYPTAPYANINSTYFANISGIQYANNTAALAGGLVPGCYYYNSSTNVVTVVV